MSVQAWLTFASNSHLRNVSYEFFKATHFIAALVFVLFFFLHCDFRLSSWDYFIATGVIYTLCWLHSHMRIFFQNGIRTAAVGMVSNDFVKISIPMNGSWKAGQHYFIRVFGLGVHGMTTHPFTACSLPGATRSLTNELVFYIRPQGGFTARLARHAQQHPKTSLKVLLDGPYSGIDMRRVAASQNTVAVAGGSGAGWLLPLIEAFLRQGEHQAAVSATNPHRDGDKDLSRKAAMKVILATRDSLTRNWFEQAVMELVANKLSGRRCDELSVDIYYTGEEDHNSAIGGPSKSEEKSQVSNESVGSGTKALSTDVRRSEEAASNIIQSALTPKHVSQRPDLPAIISDATEYGSESTSVLVCGPLSMQSDVSNAVARAQIGGMKDGKGDVYLHMEHFSWA